MNTTNMEVKETIINRPIFKILEVGIERVNLVGYIPETKEIFVNLNDEDSGKPETQAYFFKDCEEDLYAGMISTPEYIFQFIMDILYPTKDYTREYWFING